MSLAGGDSATEERLPLLPKISLALPPYMWLNPRLRYGKYQPLKEKYRKNKRRPAQIQLNGP
jgi:hypothetical protein